MSGAWGDREERREGCIVRERYVCVWERDVARSVWRKKEYVEGKVRDECVFGRVRVTGEGPPARDCSQGQYRWSQVLACIQSVSLP